MFKEEEHPRGKPGNAGQFAEKNGSGKAHTELDKAMSALDAVEKPRRAEGTEIVLSKQEYATLRAEVMKKNAAQKGRVSPVGQAFTRDYFYIYTTTGDDNFTVTMQLRIEGNEDFIDSLLKGE